MTSKNDFKPFGTSVRSSLDEMLASADEIYRMDVPSDVLWETYLSSFPEGTNPIFRERTEHDCSCCKHFIRTIGNLVTIKDGNIVTVWDGAENLGEDLYPYNVVASALAELIRGSSIKNIYRTQEAKYGAEETADSLNKNIRWNHFHVEVPSKFVDRDAGPVMSRMESAHQVFSRGLKELSPAALVDILDIINSKSLYRGEEHLESVRSFQKLQEEFSKLNSDESRDIFTWKNIKARGATFRNSVIGTLAVDLTNGVGLEDAVAKFESKAAPQNYKRPKALITPRMVEGAVAKLKDLGLEKAVERRYAVLSDISVNNVLFVDNDASMQMKDGLTEMLMAETTVSRRDPKDASPISIEDFMENIVPKTTVMELVLQNNHLSNFVSLTAPQSEDTGNLFKWDNNFAWSYDGEVADSIGARVEKAGGRVKGAKLRFSLAWFNYDDLDIHVKPPRGAEINFSNKAGKLDVDMNAGGHRSRNAVENVSWMTKPDDGAYKIYVNQYQKRENVDGGFTLEIESAGVLKQFHYSPTVRGKLPTLNVTVSKGVITAVEELCEMRSEETSQDKWGVPTLSPVRVSTLMYSPNFWDEQKVGNKHWFFMLDECVNPDATRGIYNEFLTSELEPHRKVFEILGAKTKCAPSQNQLSGVGFSSTRKDKVIVLADGRPYEITF